LAEQITAALAEHDDGAILQCEQQVDSLLSAIDLLLGNSTLH
jgi:hypothetical protein